MQQPRRQPSSYSLILWHLTAVKAANIPKEAWVADTTHNNRINNLCPWKHYTLLWNNFCEFTGYVDIHWAILSSNWFISTHYFGHILKKLQYCGFCELFMLLYYLVALDNFYEDYCEFRLAPEYWWHFANRKLFEITRSTFKRPLMISLSIKNRLPRVYEFQRSKLREPASVNLFNDAP